MENMIQWLPIILPRSAHHLLKVTLTLPAEVSQLFFGYLLPFRGLGSGEASRHLMSCSTTSYHVMSHTQHTPTNTSASASANHNTQVPKQRDTRDIQGVLGYRHREKAKLLEGVILLSVTIQDKNSYITYFLLFQNLFFQLHYMTVRFQS